MRMHRTGALEKIRNPVEPMDPLAGASPFAILDAHSSLCLVTDAVREGDAVCLALTCRALRDALWARFPRRPAGEAHAGRRLVTRWAALVATPARVVWTRELPAVELAMMQDALEGGTRASWPYILSFGNLANILKAEGVCELAAWSGALATLQWAYAEGLPTDITDNLYALSAGGGHLAVLRWLWTRHAIDSLDVRRFVRRLVRRKVLERTSGAMYQAALGGHPEVLRWLRLQISDAEWEELRDLDYRNEMCPAAALSGNLAALQWLRANGCAWGYSTTNAAAGGGHLEVLRWARANGCTWSINRSECLDAAEGGHIVVLEWLRANGHTWNEDICTAAALRGQLECLTRARANGCPWNEYTCTAAARWGHLDVLKWARASGCPWDKVGCLNAADVGGVGGAAVRVWIQEQDPDEAVEEET